MVSASKVVPKQKHPNTVRWALPVPHLLKATAHSSRVHWARVPVAGKSSWGLAPSLKGRNICLAGRSAGRSRVGEKLGPSWAMDLGAPSFVSTRTVNVKMYQLIYVNFSRAEYAENKSKKDFWFSSIYNWNEVTFREKGEILKALKNSLLSGMLLKLTYHFIFVYVYHYPLLSAPKITLEQ